MHCNVSIFYFIFAVLGLKLRASHMLVLSHQATPHTQDSLPCLFVFGDEYMPLAWVWGRHLWNEGLFSTRLQRRSREVRVTFLPLLLSGFVDVLTPVGD